MNISVYLTTESVYHTGVYIVYLPLVQTNRFVSNPVDKALYCHSPKNGLWSSSGYPITIIMCKSLCCIQIAHLMNNSYCKLMLLAFVSVLSWARPEENKSILLLMQVYDSFPERATMPLWKKKLHVAIIWPHKCFHGYLYNQKFTVQTDHQPLLWLYHKTNANLSLMGWALAIPFFIPECYM